MPPVPAAYTVEAGLLEYGIENVRERTVELTGYLIDEVESRGFEVATPHEDDRRGAVVNIQVKHPDRTLETLRFRDVAAGARNGGIRAGLHFYNTKAELDRFVDMLDEVAIPR
jgi:selenocysteine lyase/cysteine desulfurase